MGKTLVNVDFDGVLIPNYFEKELIEKGTRGGLPPKISQFDGRTFEWYIEKVNTSLHAPLNVNLLGFFAQHRDRFTFRLWTNRNIELRDKTIANLGDWKPLFDSFKFYSGSKGQSKVEGTVIDNSVKYLICGEVGIHYEWR